MTESESQASAVGPLSGEKVRHGTGVNSNRAFPTDSYPYNLDPFVLFEQFYIDPDNGFPMHPHRGFEIVSYMIEGGMEHEDSLGVANTAYENDAMRITTGSGIRHSEFPADGQACTGLQLWVNLPQAEKDADPDYGDATADTLPTAEQGGATVTTVIGEGSPISLHTPMEYLDAAVADTWTWSVPEGWSGFLYGVAGDGTVEGQPFTAGDVLPVTDTRSVTLQSDDSLRVVAVSGRPHGEPIRQRGPYVL
ncbi:unknown [Haloarcula marismortui ATCC 43049]|jgi:redox-sensitive bicupin YhaK (pirin superfamily)|uniref:Pirin family protein n=1 Tax=Haloarcula marismortui (strain ATCC 43049 / DSM 3752 / JCM 8966 / VKM B-1809) TaxID=272569 RepID=Q5V258_HALMA|nr:pirin family protein [Haloarcula marismortui]AAV46394.1 unknown [Haloarcula marismortui ATCC 43049]QCP91124.1 pirin family protein [Haloarcula marismortui ATCC 43049]